MNSDEYMKNLAAELSRLGCGTVITVEDVMLEILSVKDADRMMSLDLTDLAQRITRHVDEAGFMDLVQIAVQTAVVDALSVDDSVLLRNEEALHG